MTDEDAVHILLSITLEEYDYVFEKLSLRGRKNPSFLTRVKSKILHKPTPPGDILLIGPQWGEYNLLLAVLIPNDPTSIETWLKTVIDPLPGIRDTKALYDPHKKTEA